LWSGGGAFSSPWNSLRNCSCCHSLKVRSCLTYLFAAFADGVRDLFREDARSGNCRSPEGRSGHGPGRIARAPQPSGKPDVILATGSSTVAALLGATRTVPIVFAHAVDPVAAGFVDSLARPGGNATGFVLFEYGISAKWLELLKEIAPNVTRVAVLRDPPWPLGRASSAPSSP
jgi:ABC transporter substrate binding protein